MKNCIVIMLAIALCLFSVNAFAADTSSTNVNVDIIGQPLNVITPATIPNIVIFDADVTNPSTVPTITPSTMNVQIDGGAGTTLVVRASQYDADQGALGGYFNNEKGMLLTSTEWTGSPILDNESRDPILGGAELFSKAVPGTAAENFDITVSLDPVDIKAKLPKGPGEEYDYGIDQMHVEIWIGAIVN